MFTTTTFTTNRIPRLADVLARLPAHPRQAHPTSCPGIWATDKISPSLDNRGKIQGRIAKLAPKYDEIINKRRFHKGF
jgi:hypothetical protein